MMFKLTSTTCKGTARHMGVCHLLVGPKRSPISHRAAGRSKPTPCDACKRPRISSWTIYLSSLDAVSKCRKFEKVRVSHSKTRLGRGVGGARMRWLCVKNARRPVRDPHFCASLGWATNDCEFPTKEIQITLGHNLPPPRLVRSIVNLRDVSNQIATRIHACLEVVG